MKPALVDTDILSEFLRGTSKVVENVETYLQTYDAVGPGARIPLSPHLPLLVAFGLIGVQTLPFF